VIKSAVTVSLVAQAKGGPFVYWDGLASAAASAAKHGFDALEVFAPSAAAIDRPALRALLQKHGLAAAAFGTGGGWLVHKWHLTHADPAIRSQAREFIRAIIDAGREFQAPPIPRPPPRQPGGPVPPPPALLVCRYRSLWAIGG